MLMEEKLNIKQEAHLLEELTVKELVSRYKKELSIAKQMVKGIDLYGLVLQEPLRLHESPEKWAVIILTHFDDFEALERYYL
ncbi:hypothetical protein [Bacillus cereus]|uniref:hypothetical protein n=1 Tax=Bacillus cereus group TaxID=86661 RepID=UPI0002EDA20C|nr:hypothetical protein [Bacillus cereus]HDR4560896.1 hypothetical protein [Bacillus luti]